MKKALLVLAVAAGGLTFASSVPATGAAPRNYDCSKAGNANKAACKGKAAPAAAKTTTTAAHKATASTKVAAKTAAAAPAPAPAPAHPSMLDRLKSVMSSKSTTTTTKSATATKAAPHRAATTSNEDRNPAGAIAQCKDGTYSHSKGRTGACSRHGGVAKWS